MYSLRRFFFVFVLRLFLLTWKCTPSHWCWHGVRNGCVLCVGSLSMIFSFWAAVELFLQLNGCKKQPLIIHSPPERCTLQETGTWCSGVLLYKNCSEAGLSGLQSMAVTSCLLKWLLQPSVVSNQSTCVDLWPLTSTVSLWMSSFSWDHLL